MELPSSLRYVTLTWRFLSLLGGKPFGDIEREVMRLLVCGGNRRLDGMILPALEQLRGVDGSS